MLNSIYRGLIQRHISVINVVNITHNNKLCRCVQLQPHHFSSTAAQKPISEIANKDSFTVNYLINTFGFSKDKALSASKYLKFGSKEKPDLVVAFLKKQCFTEEQIKCLVRKFSYFMAYDPENTLLPKIEFFRSRGISDAEVTKIFLEAPALLSCSLNKQILPSFNYLKSLFDASETSLGSMSRFAGILLCDVESRLRPNIEILRDAGVPNSNIMYMLQYQSRAFRTDVEKFTKAVEQAKQMQFKPNQMKFVLAIMAFQKMSEQTWEKKVAVYKKWGWSNNDVISTFGKNPYCMMKCTDKITTVMDFVVNKMGFDSSLVLKMPGLLIYSLEKRVKPRFVVYEKLSENGLIERGSLLHSMFSISERIFLERFVQRYEKEVPELLQLYQKELAAAKS